MVETWQEVVFWLTAFAMAFSAMRVVTTRNVVHAALYLVVTLMGAAVLYLLLTAEFVAWVQVLVYVGAIVVLTLFGLMLTRAPIGTGHYDNDQRWLALLCSVAVFAVTAWVLIDTFGDQKISLVRQTAKGVRGTETAALGEVIFSVYVLPFEVVSVLLLAALVGAVVIARRDDDEDRPHRRSDQREIV